MSGIAAIFQRNGVPSDPRVLRAMVESLRHRGPDGISEWVSGCVGLGHCLMRITPESFAERYPLSSVDGTCWIAWDGRLDNRDELLAKLQLPAEQPDPALVLAAYQRWGEQAAAELLGDFAFAIWDKRTQSLFAARDRIGIKPLYYAEDGGRMLFASEAKVLLRALNRAVIADDEMVVAAWLAECRETDNHRSLFSGIRRLPPAHWMRVTPQRCEIMRYWRIEASRRIAYQRSEAYIEHFRAVLDEAVRARTRSAFPVGCFLSGGLDSSALTMLAARHAPVEAFTVFGQRPADDERPFAQQLAQSAGVSLWTFEQQICDPFDGLEQQLWKLEGPLIAMNHHTEAFDALVRCRNCRVVLDGDGADHLLDEFGYLADVLRHHGVLAFIRQTRAFAAWYGGRFTEFAGIVLEGMLPQPAKVFGKHWLRGIPPAWMNRDTARANRLAERIRQTRAPVDFPDFSQAFSYASALSPTLLLRLEQDERHAAYAGRELRLPFLDSRLIEFIFAVPWQHRSRDGQRKWLLRQAMAGILPQTVRLRRGKGDWSAGMDDQLLKICRQTPCPLLADVSGIMDRYVHRPGAEKLVARYLAGQLGLRWDVWSLAAFDHWLNVFCKGVKNNGIETFRTQEALPAADAALSR